MSTDTLIMVVLICVGCALGLAGLAVLGFHALVFLKTARDAGVSSRAHAQEIMGRAQRLGPRFRDLKRKQKAVTEGLARLSATAGRSEQSDG
jgi:hypothetical protein